ncbi:MAG: SH3 domain-containing protein [Desulfobaccales bacterium]
MRLKFLTRLLLLTLLLGLAWSCATTPVTPPDVYFYVSQEITYLKDSPGDSANVLGLLYKGDKVERVEEGKTDWWRVKVLRSGQTGWVRKGLLSAEPVPTAFYYINADTVPLRECPGSDCLPLQMLFRGEQVQRVAEGDQGWWRVLVIKGHSLGWVPAAALTAQYEETQQKPARKPYFYVAVARLNLHARPAPRSEVVRALKFNAQVEKIGESGAWFKVRQISSGAVGWVLGRDLETLPLTSPRGQAPARQEPKPFQQREEPLLEPDFI